MAEMQKKNQGGKIEGTLVYVCCSTPKKKYQSEDMEYSVSVIVDKATAKIWNKQFSKQKAKEYEAAEFEEKCKTKAPDGWDEVFVISLKKPHTKDGVVQDPKYRPRVYLDTGTTNKDGRSVLKDITTTKLIANGSKGIVSYREMDNDFGHFAQLVSIRIKEEDLIEYHAISKGSEWDDAVIEEDDDGIVVNDNSDNVVEAASVEKPEKKVVSAGVKQKISDDNDEDSPF